ncbi:MAG: nickel-dependent lactate racemase, partial [Eubacteriales bacterium]|nr:nickel-dependent lactate racemase [Eubacteriales bacterium]
MKMNMNMNMNGNGNGNGNGNTNMNENTNMGTDKNAWTGKERIRIPYGRGHIDAAIDRTRLKAVLTPPTLAVEVLREAQQTIVREALGNPICSERLSVLATGKKKILVITSDHTRPVPSRVTMPLLLEEIRKGNPEADIKILLATGFHRASTEDEIRDKFGDAIAKNETIINHDSRNAAAMTFKGILPSGGELWLNSLVEWADLIVAEGFIEPHFFAGFSGGRKSILPGIASEKTIFANHCSKFIADRNARAGILEGNPLHRDMLYAVEAVGLSFIL